MDTDAIDCCSYGKNLDGVVIEELIKSSKSWNSQPLPAYSTGAPEITISRIVIYPGGKIPLHKHPIICCCVILKGEMVVIAEGQGEHRIKAGDATIETVEKWHSAYNPGPLTAEMIAFYAGVVGRPITVVADGGQDFEESETAPESTADLNPRLKNP